MVVSVGATVSIRRPTIGKRVRSDLQEHLLENDYGIAEGTNDRVALEVVLRARGELLAGRSDVIAVVDPATAVRLLADRDIVLGYVETLAAEAAVRRGGGDDLRARAIEQRALAIARAVPQTNQRDEELDALVAGLNRRASESTTPREDAGG
jgi:hypothetical protein